MVFMSLCPRSKDYTGCNVEGIPVRVIQSDGVEISPHVKFTSNDLDNGAKYFHNNSGKSDSFSVVIMVNVEDTVQITKEFDDLSWVENFDEWDTEIESDITFTDDTLFEVDSVYAKLGKQESIVTILDYFIRKGEPFYVTTRAVGINKEDLWIITENKSRKQEFDDGYVKWSLTFTKYIEYNFATFKNTNTGVTNALNKYKKKQASKKKTAQKKAKAKSKTTTKSKLEKNCKASNLKYSQKKKVVTCVKYMQEILYKKGCFKTNNKSQIDGWYGSTTKNAVKQFQKKYAKQYKLKQTGNVDNATFKALCKA